MMLPWTINTAWMLCCRREAVHFRRATMDVESAQADQLRRILAANSASQFGRKHKFETIGNARDFQARVPLSTYDDCAGAIERVARGEERVLTTEAVRLFEPTSGTSGGEKLIPYTASLRMEFQRAVAAWICDLQSTRPALRKGRAYWSISPAFGNARKTAGGIPIGFDDDTAYLGGLGRYAMNRLLIRPPGIAGVHDLEAFRYCTLLWLLRAPDLTLISIWSPSFLIALLANLEVWEDRLCRDIDHGTVSARGEIDDRVLAKMRAACRPDPRRARDLKSIFNSGGSQFEKIKQVWPRLALISCWCDAAAAAPAAQLRLFFPGVEIQPKGLLATEACISIPLTGRHGAALALRSHFFEFETANGEIHLAHELEPGVRYGVIVTTGGGLYRYRMRDEIDVVGFENQCPLIRFLGKSDQVSDLVGEKLDETHVRAALDRVFAKFDIDPLHAILAPCGGTPPYYSLYLQLDDSFQSCEEAIAAALESELAANPHYRYAVGLRQLAPARVRLCGEGAESLQSMHERARLQAGQKLGAIKPLALEKRPEIAAALEARVRAGIAARAA